jgi:hypothetical protein
MVMGVKEQWSWPLKGPENENWMKRDPARKKEPLDFLSPLFDVSRQHHTGLYNSRSALLFLLLVLLFFTVYSSVTFSSLPSSSSLFLARVLEQFPIVLRPRALPLPRSSRHVVV